VKVTEKVIKGCFVVVVELKGVSKNELKAKKASYYV